MCFGASSRDWKELGEESYENGENLKIIHTWNYKAKYSNKFQKINQVEDGVRGATNAKTKNIFLDNYYKFDGTTMTADIINFFKYIAKAGASSNEDFNDPDWFINHKGSLDYEYNARSILTYNGKEIKLTAIDEYLNENDGELKVKPSDVAGAISLNHDSLNTFSILKNMHTLDSEYIYHDFKELVVELDYFDKEELVDSGEEVMMFPVKNLSAEGWPVARYDRSEEFYGTLIHSKEDLKAKEGEILAELISIFGIEEVQESMETEYAGGSSGVTSTNSNNPLVKAADEVMSVLAPTGEYSQAERMTSLAQLKQAATPKTDCSGFVSICLQQVGLLNEGESYSSGSFATNLASIQGIQIIDNPSVEQLEPGMLCYWAPDTSSRGSGHINIYAGNGLSYDWGGVYRKQPFDYLNSTKRGKPSKAIKIPESAMSYSGSGSSSTSNTSSTGTNKSTSGQMTTSEFLAIAEQVRKPMEWQGV